MGWHELGIAQVLGEQSSLNVGKLKIQNCFGESQSPLEKCTMFHVCRLLFSGCSIHRPCMLSRMIHLERIGSAHFPALVLICLQVLALINHANLCVLFDSPDNCMSDSHMTATGCSFVLALDVNRECEDSRCQMQRQENIALIFLHCPI